MDFVFHTLAPRVTALKVWKTGSSKVGGPRTMYAPLLLSLSPELCMVEKSTIRMDYKFLSNQC